MLKVCALCLLLGTIVGLVVGITAFRPSSDGAVVKQLKIDKSKVEDIKQKVEIRYVEKERIRTVIKRVPDDTGCVDAVLPADVSDRLLDAFDTARSTTH